MGRGLCQGDPLSPYLFLLCDEGLSSLITTAEYGGRLTGLPIAKGGSRLSHLFFVNDSLLFCLATFMEWHTVHEILETYECASGQKINRDKTFIFLAKILIRPLGPISSLFQVFKCQMVMRNTWAFWPLLGVQKFVLLPISKGMS